MYCLSTLSLSISELEPLLFLLLSVPTHSTTPFIQFPLTVSTVPSTAISHFHLFPLSISHSSGTPLPSPPLFYFVFPPPSSFQSFLLLFPTADFFHFPLSHHRAIPRAILIVGFPRSGDSFALLSYLKGFHLYGKARDSAHCPLT